MLNGRGFGCAPLTFVENQKTRPDTGSNRSDRV
jgi:hypothetical protein